MPGATEIPDQQRPGMNDANTDVHSLDRAAIGVMDEGEVTVNSATTAFINCMERLEQLIERETKALKACAPVDFDELNLRKAHALLEFMRVSRAVPAAASFVVADQLAALRAKLSENSSMLDQHLRAMVEIAGIMIRSIEIEESDGTYSGRPVFSR